jgi:nuclear receptor co-repressor 1
LILMPPEPLPWDRKDFFKERKHERSESLGSVARWRDSSHHRDFNRWGSADFRRPPGELLCLCPFDLLLSMVV